MVDKVGIEELERACIEDQTKAPLPGRNTGGCSGCSVVVCRSVDRMNWSFMLARLPSVFHAKSKVSTKASECMYMLMARCKGNASDEVLARNGKRMYQN